MTAPRPPTVQRLNFRDVELGNGISVSTEANWSLNLLVDSLENGLPIGEATFYMPGGRVHRVATLVLHGCGIWTNRRENPVQQQERAFSLQPDALIIGSYLLFAFQDSGMLRLDEPQQKISSFSIYKQTETSAGTTALLPIQWS